MVLLRLKCLVSVAWDCRDNLAGGRPGPGGGGGGAAGAVLQG